MANIIPIPKIFSAILIAFLTLIMIRVTYPIADHVIGLFDEGMMKISAILAYWLIIVFVTWFLLWSTIFRKEEQKLGG